MSGRTREMPAGVALPAGDSLGVVGKSTRDAALVESAEGWLDAAATDVAMRLSSGTPAGGETTDAATLLSSGPPSERRIGCEWAAAAARVPGVGRVVAED